MSAARLRAPGSSRRGQAGLALALAALVAVALAALLLGARSLPPGAAVSALFAFDPADPAQVVVRELRLPRLWAGLLAGAALGVAGVIMQAVTRNPLAEPGLLGLNAGAAFAVVLAATLWPALGAGRLALFAFPGAAGAAAAVLLLGGAREGGASPVRLALAGAALTALLLSLVTLLITLRQEALDVQRFWVVGSLAAAPGRPLAAMAPAALAGLALALALAGRLDLLALGEETARGLGLRTGRVLAGAILAVTLLAGAAVAVAGPVAFLGLVVPHLARMIAGASARAAMVVAAPLGATLLLAADLLGRVVAPPGEIRVGIVMALIGGPAFALIVRRMKALAG